MAGSGVTGRHTPCYTCRKCKGRFFIGTSLPTPIVLEGGFVDGYICPSCVNGHNKSEHIRVTRKPVRRKKTCTYCGERGLPNVMRQIQKLGKPAWVCQQCVDKACQKSA